VVVVSAGTISNRAAAAVTSSEPAIVAIAAVASSLTYAATEVRRNWKDLGIDLQRVADDAEHLARLHARPPRSLRRPRLRLKKRHSV